MMLLLSDDWLHSKNYWTYAFDALLCLPCVRWLGERQIMQRSEEKADSKSEAYRRLLHPQDAYVMSTQDGGVSI